MVPKLTAGAIQRIINDEKVSKAVVQLLGYKKLPGGVYDRYRLLLSDGFHFTPFAMLGTQLNPMVENNELEKFTVIQIDKCVCNHVSSEKKVIILLNVTVLAPGDEVCEKIGDPQNVVATSDAVSTAGAQTDSSSGAAVNNNFSSPTLVAQEDQMEERDSKLTAGAIQRIMGGEEVCKAVVQLLGYKIVPGGGISDRYRLLLSDGCQFTPFAMLGTSLNHMVVNNKLEKFTIIQIDKYVCNNVTSEKKVLILLGVTVLVPGDKVCEKIGHPVQLEAKSASARAQKDSSLGGANNNTPDLSSAVQSKIMVPKLTAKAIKSLMNGEKVPKAVVQLLGCKKVPDAGSNYRYRLILSDGYQFTPYGMLGTQLNHMVANNELEKFTVIQIDKCVCNHVSLDKKVIILLEVTVLAPGNEVGEKIGNPQILNVLSDTMNITAEAQKDSSSGVVIDNTNVNSTRDADLCSGTCKSETMDLPNPCTGSDFSNGCYSDQSIKIHPINSLTPYQNKWTIRARVTSKAPIQHLSWKIHFGTKGEGKLFSVNLLDESGEIRATGFNEAVDKFYNLLEVNKVFYISKATLKAARKSYSSFENDYEMTFNNDTDITLCEDNASSIPMFQFNFVPISQIQHIDKDNTIDVIGICKYADDMQIIVADTEYATNTELEKRNINLVDTTNTEVSLMLWGEEAKKFDPSNNPVVSVKRARVSDFSGRSLSMDPSSCLQINPDIKEAHVLRGWYDKESGQSEPHDTTMKGAVGGTKVSSSFNTSGNEKVGS